MYGNTWTPDRTDAKYAKLMWMPSVYTNTQANDRYVYYEGYATKEEAMRREYAIKQLTRKEKLKLMEFWTETSAD